MLMNGQVSFGSLSLRGTKQAVKRKIKRVNKSYQKSLL
jgi:hypothetical protein